LEKKIEENAYFSNSADDILADDKFPSMQRVKKEIQYFFRIVAISDCLQCIVVQNKPDGHD